MKNENEFNAEMSHILKRFRPQVHAYKPCDRFTEGVADFILWGKSHSLGLENKFIKTMPAKNTKILQKHPFTGAQITFLENLVLAGNLGMGLVGIEDRGLMYIIKPHELPQGGDWTRDEFDKCCFPTVPWLNMEEFLERFL